MTLKKFVDGLGKIPKDELTLKQREEFTESVIFPPNSAYQRTEISRAVWREDAIILAIHGNFPMQEVQARESLSALLLSLKQRRFTPKTFSVDAKNQWSISGFENGKSVGSMRKIKIRASYYTIDNTKLRIGFTAQSHVINIEADLNTHQVSIDAEGEYTSLLPDIFNLIHPQNVTIHFTPEDAKTVIDKVPSITRKYLENALKPKKQNYLALSLGGMSFGEKENISITLSSNTVAALESLLGKSLFRDPKERTTCITNMNKTIIFTKNILKCLKSLVALINSFRPDVMFNHPLVTTAEAKSLLEKEMEIVLDSFKIQNWLIFGHNTHMVRGGLVKRLASEYFQEDLWGPYEEMEADEYLKYLISRGFVKEEITDKTIPSIGYIMKQWYLMRFIHQAYLNDPKDLVEQVRNSYVNKAPEIDITGETRIDASDIKSLILPNESTMSYLQLQEQTSEADNDISFEIKEDKTVRLWVRLSVESAKLLDLQDNLCNQFGINFS